MTGPVLLRAWREAQGLTQAGLGALLEVGGGKVRIAQWETGARVPSLPWAVAIARITGGAVPVEAWTDQSSSPISRSRS